MTVNYRKAEPEDIPHIYSLNAMYCRAYTENTKDKGFLKNSFTLIEIGGLVDANEIVVAENGGNIIGYYLVNSIYNTTKTILKRQHIIDKLIADGVLPAGRYVYLTQAAVSLHFMKKGIAKELLVQLKILIRDRFDFLIGFIDRENNNAKEAHLRSGWKIIAEMDDGYLALTETVKA